MRLSPLLSGKTLATTLGLVNTQLFRLASRQWIADSQPLHKSCFPSGTIRPVAEVWLSMNKESPDWPSVRAFYFLL